MRHSIIIFAATSLLAATYAQAHDSSYYAAGSVLSSGKWVKIKVAETGIQQIDAATLRSLGFDNPEKVAVYGYGGALLLDDRFSTNLPDDLPRQASMFAEGKLMFYGQGAENVTVSGKTTTPVPNPYSFYGYYFLTESAETPAAPRQIAYVPAANSVETHTAAYAVNREVQSYEYLGERWFDTMLESDKATTYRFPVADAVKSGDMRLSYAWASDENASITISLPPEATAANPTGVSIANPSSLVRRTGYADITAADGITVDTLSVDIRLTAARPARGFVAMDYAALMFRRVNTLGTDAQRRMYVTTAVNENIRFRDIPSNAIVWDVTSPVNVRQYEINSEEITPASSGAATIILFDPKARQHVPQVADYELKTQNLHAAAVPHMLIVTVSQLHEQAEQLAEIHRQEQGIDVLVADADEIYNEFSSGAFSAMGIRRFVKMLYDRDPKKLRSLLLYGTGSYDMRHITHSMPILPVRECSQDAYMFSPSQSYCADSYFAMLDDNYNPNTIWHQYPRIAVGRLPIHTPEQAMLVNDKIERFITTPHWQRAANTSLFVADNVDEGQYHKSLDEVAEEIGVRPGELLFKDYVDFFPDDYNKSKSPQLNSSISSHIHEGIGFLHYMGHSSYDGFVTGVYGVTSEEARKYTNSSLPIFILSTCNLGHFDGPQSTLGVASMLAPNAAIAAITYARESWARGNENSHAIIGRHLSSAKSGMTLGELWLNIRTECVKYHMSSTRYSINDLNRNLLGDPELPLRFPEYKATLSLLDDASTELTPLSSLKISGTVCDGNGNTVSDFDGKVQIRALLEEIPMTTRGIRDKEAKGMTYMCGSIPVSTTTADIKGGAYNATMVLPDGLGSNKIRFALYAESTDMTRAAVGELDGFSVVPSSSAIDNPDTSAPEIVEFFVASPQNIATRKTDTIKAVISADPSGIALGASPLETSLNLSIDGKSIDNATRHYTVETDGSVTLTAPIGPLADGRHCAELSVSDNAGNRSQRSISFEVVTADVSATLQCLTEIARDKATFMWEHTYMSTEPEINIIITDRRGHTVANTRINSGDESWDWNLHDMNGAPVANGTYRASIIATDSLRYTSSSPVTFTVLR